MPENEESAIKYRGTANNECLCGGFKFEDNIKTTFTVHLMSLGNNEQGLIL